MTTVKPKTKPKSTKPQGATAMNIMIWNLNGGHVPEKTARRIEGAVASIIRESRNSRLMYDMVKEY